MKDMPITMEPDGWLGQTGGYAKDMTLRQYIAIKAMQAILSNPDYMGEDSELAVQSYNVADAMLQAGKD